MLSSAAIEDDVAETLLCFEDNCNKSQCKPRKQSDRMHFMLSNENISEITKHYS